MKREKRLTKKERKSAEGVVARPAARAPSARGAQHEHAHIHCIACGKHLDPDMFGESAAFYRCQHGSDFPHCLACSERAKALVDEHDRTNRPVQTAAAWH